MHHQPLISLILAAGRSSRFGSDKRQAHLPGGLSLLETVIRAHREVFETVWVLTREQDEFAARLCRALGVRQLPCAAADQGLGSTLAAGIQAVEARDALAERRDPPSVEAVVLSLADMPGVRPATLYALAERFAATGQAVAPIYAGPSGPTVRAGQIGHPRIVPRAYWPALRGLNGDQGARQAVDWQQAQLVPSSDAGVLLDIDRPEDLAAWVHHQEPAD